MKTVSQFNLYYTNKLIYICIYEITADIFNLTIAVNNNRSIIRILTDVEVNKTFFGTVQQWITDTYYSFNGNGELFVFRILV